MALYQPDACADDRRTYIFEEHDCVIKKQKKYETLTCLGNGYIGMRSAFCEEHSSQGRLTLIAGLYDQQPCEVEELMPLPDATVLNITVNKEKIGPMSDRASRYSRELNLQNGLLTYSYRYALTDSQNTVSVTQRRFVSMENRHLAVFETTLRTEEDAEVAVASTVSAKQTVSGTQHTFEEERTVMDGDLLWYGGRASVAGTSFRTGSRMRIFVNGIEQSNVQRYATSRRSLAANAKLKLAKGDKLRILRYVLYYTANDAEWADQDASSIQTYICAEMDRVSGTSFDNLLALSRDEWSKRWKHCDIRIDCDDPRETLKTRMAMYHTIIMCPAHDDRLSIAAKGLTGMGYAGHVFWDCELFNLPFFIYTDPDAARKLCTYRYRTLDGARRKATEYGYRGAMYPWESSSMRGDEQCPTVGNYSADNTRRHISCGEIEHHVVCDVAYGVYDYAKATADTDFLNRYGLEILFETADFWQSRLEYKPEADRYEICQVTGPDEYKEYVDNDVFTNYMADWNMRTALCEAERLQKEEPARFAELDGKLGLTRLMNEIRKKLCKLYLPTPNKNGLIPQNDSYLQLEQIDLTKYKTSGINRMIYRDYSIDRISRLMVSKQADLIQLIALMPSLFPLDTVKQNFDFYESKCLHDSSLSLSAYATVAARVLRDADFAHGFFKKALDTDFGEESTLSNDGIHAANCGGIWQTVVFGFAGIDTSHDILHITPSLPSSWKALTLRMTWKGCELKITAEPDRVSIESLNGKELSLVVCGKTVSLKQRVTVSY